MRKWKRRRRREQEQLESDNSSFEEVYAKISDQAIKNNREDLGVRSFLFIRKEVTPTCYYHRGITFTSDFSIPEVKMHFDTGLG